MNVRQLRVVRWVQVSGLALSAGDAALMLDRGHFVAALLPAVLIAVWALLLCVQTKLIRRQRRIDAIASRPRPDYSAIARMEREVYGREFGHDGAPGFPPGSVENAVALASGNGLCDGCGGRLALYGTMYRPTLRDGPFYCAPCYRHAEARREAAGS